MGKYSKVFYRVLHYYKAMLQNYKATLQNYKATLQNYKAILQNYKAMSSSIIVFFYDNMYNFLSAKIFRYSIQLKMFTIKCK